MPIKRVYVGVDRQDYVINWTNRRDKRKVILHAVGSADNETGYVFGMHLNFDPSLDSGEIGKDAATIEDYNLPHPFRRYARVWLSCDYIEAINRGIKRRSTISEGSLTEKINYTYDEAL